MNLLGRFVCWLARNKVDAAYAAGIERGQIIADERLKLAYGAGEMEGMRKAAIAIEEEAAARGENCPACRCDVKRARNRLYMH